MRRLIKISGNRDGRERNSERESSRRTDEDHPERGLTLLANRPLRAEEVVVSLPRKARVMRAVSDDDEEDIYSWSKALAKQLEFDERKKHGMWLQSLPKEAPKVPGLYMGIEDIERWVKDVQLRERLIRSRKDHCAFVNEEMNNSEKDNKDLSRMRSFLQSRMLPMVNKDGMRL